MGSNLKELDMRDNFGDVLVVFHYFLTVDAALIRGLTLDTIGHQHVYLHNLSLI